MRILFIYLMVFATNVSACYVPKNGYRWGATELIEKSERIVVAKLARQEIGDFWVDSRLIVVEVIKGSSLDDIVFQTTLNASHDNSDYYGHWSPLFWLPWVGRGEYPCCICGPDFTFSYGELYLLFPDAFGAFKSAEIIKSKDDVWYKYVKNSVSSL